MDVFGCWQLRAILLVALVKAPSAWQMASILFIAPSPPHFWCADRPNASDACERPCHRYEFAGTASSIVTQWQLVCDRAVLVPVSQVCYLFGILVGGVMCTLLLGWFSPRRILLVAMILQVLAGEGVAYAPQFELQCFLRFVTAASCAHMFTCGYVICTDITCGRARTIVAACYEHFWSVGVVTLAGLGYALHDWKQLQQCISLPTLLIILTYVWIPDSPKWLMEKGRDAEARLILEEAAAFNGTKLTAIDPPSTTSSKREATWCDLLRQPHCLALHIVWAATIVTYYGALLNVKNVGPHLYFNTVIAGFAEVAGVLLGLAIILWCSRKWLALAIILLVGGSACLTCWALPPQDEASSEVSMLGLAMVGRVAIAVSLTMLQVKSGELLPKVGVFSCVTFGRIFLLGAPFIGYLAMYGDKVSLSAFGAITFLGGVAAFFITKPKEKPQQIPVLWTVDMAVAFYK